MRCVRNSPAFIRCNVWKVTRQGALTNGHMQKSGQWIRGRTRTGLPGWICALCSKTCPLDSTFLHENKFLAKKIKEYLPLAQKIWSRQKVGNFCFCNNNYTLHKSSCLTAWPGARCTAHPFQKPVFIESYLDNLSNLPSNRSRCVLKQFLAECRWVGTVIRASGSGPSIV